MQLNPPTPIDLYSQALRDAFAVLDRYKAGIPGRDPTKSLNEDQYELLWRVRGALNPLMFLDGLRREDVAEIASRIDDLLAAESQKPQKHIPRMGEQK